MLLFAFALIPQKFEQQRDVAKVILRSKYSTDCWEESQSPEEGEAQRADHEQPELSEERDLGEQQETCSRTGCESSRCY